MARKTNYSFEKRQKELAKKKKKEEKRQQKLKAKQDGVEDQPSSDINVDTVGDSVDPLGSPDV